VTNMKVIITHGDLKAEFDGPPEEVYVSVVRFMEKAIPAYSLASKLQTAAGVEEIVEKLKDKVLYSQSDGLILKMDLTGTPTSTAILLFAATRYLNHILGKADSNEVSAAELAGVLGKPEKTVSGRLSELIQRNLLKRVGRGGYVITPLGLAYLKESSETE